MEQTVLLIGCSTVSLGYAATESTIDFRRMQLLIADDSSIFRDALRRTLELVNEIEKIDEAANGEEAIRKVAEVHPDLVIMDISMPVMDGLSAARIIKMDFPQTKILILSEHQGRYVTDAIKLLGVEGFVPKREAGDKLVPTVLSFGNQASH